MVREGNYFDGLVLYLSKWNWDNHESWHLYNWDAKDDETAMLALYEAEQYHPYAASRYKEDFEKFQNDWKTRNTTPARHTLSRTVKLKCWKSCKKRWTT